MATVAAAAGGGVAESADAGLVDGLRAAFLAALAFALLGVVATFTLMRERDCKRELVRRRSEDGARLDALAAGCLTGLGGRVIDAEFEHGRR
ncbi:MAG: hypothetical protein ICV71_00050 [Thermoleophilia bacterium]|nr:hypothetical protein [Thermoleophilia bacterium]